MQVQKLGSNGRLTFTQSFDTRRLDSEAGKGTNLALDHDFIA